MRSAALLEEQKLREAHRDATSKTETEVRGLHADLDTARYTLGREQSQHA